MTFINYTADHHRQKDNNNLNYSLKMLFRLTILFLASANVVGCATTKFYGTSAAVNEESLSQIHTATSSTNDLRNLLGEPTEIQSISLNNEIWIYRYLEYTGTYLPLFGTVTTGNKLEGTVKFYIQDNQVARIERSRSQKSAGL